MLRIESQPRRVMFLHRTAQGGLGSKLMRCDQLSKMARAYLGDRYAFEVRKIAPAGRSRHHKDLIRDADGAVLIFLKQAAAGLKAEDMAQIKRRARGICIDYVDAPMSDAAQPMADIHIAASLAGFYALRSLLDGGDGAISGVARLLTHHADPRLTPVARYQDRCLSVGYFGAAANTAIPAPLRDVVKTTPLRSGRGFADMLSAMRRSNLHYAVRPRILDCSKLAFKPFTKGFNAAQVNANVIVNRDADDAEAYLGADYPFLIQSDSPTDIAEGIRHARDGFGCAEWREGLDRMAEVRAQCAPPRIMAQLRGILETFD